jgi:hypothetical protein
MEHGWKKAMVGNKSNEAGALDVIIRIIRMYLDDDEDFEVSKDDTMEEIFSSEELAHVAPSIFLSIEAYFNVDIPKSDAEQTLQQFAVEIERLPKVTNKMFLVEEVRSVTAYYFEQFQKALEDAD